ncbi:MAG: galactose-1-phosphate uridylyltransferase [Candidatus Riflebacteria bacterium]|nr:galactose-1-phosphate uridylyltransferase [Candidatus Riflebacteria bacterium]
MPQLRKDPILKQWVIISPERGKRPHDFRLETEQIDDPETCPFCEGHEGLTPLETMAFRKAGTALNQPGWWVRVIPDRDPILVPTGDTGREGIGMFDAMNAIGIHEVVVETPSHTQTLQTVPLDQVREVIWTYKQRMLDIKKNPRFKHLMIVKNSGRSVSNFSHSHSHIVATPIIPKRIEEEIDGAREYYHYHDRCIFCDIIKQELDQPGRIIYQDAYFVAFCPFASRFPFEVMIIPKTHQPFFEAIDNDHVHGFAQILQITLKKMQALLANLPYNFIIHTSPCSDSYRDFFHWHLELIPKLTQVAGFEWGSGFYINPLPPEDAAQFLRDAVI